MTQEESTDAGVTNKSNVRPKIEKLPSINEIRNAVPAHCFERSAIRGILYVARDVFMAAICAFLAYTFLDTSFPKLSDPFAIVKWIIGWSVYSFWQGACLTGLWVLAHECGHGAFSSSQLFNDIIGYVLHTILLVPYFSWQFSHKKHHQRTNHLLEGETHVPGTKKGWGIRDDEPHKGFAALHSAMGDDAFAVFQLVSHLIFGWPLYLLRNDSGGRTLYDGTRKTRNDVLDHFRPSSKLFTPKVQRSVLISTLGIVVFLAGLVKCSYDYGTLSVLLFYGFPYLWVNFWLVLYTWMHHTHVDVPHYGSSDWTWLKGATCTIDRPYGIFDWFHHDIGSTHVVHHIFSNMPCYHAAEATKHIKEILGSHYHYDGTFWPIAAFRLARDCHFVDGVEGIQYYKKIPSKNN